MNERICKIAQETDAWCDQRYLGEDSYDIEWETKFAELIVRECEVEGSYTIRHQLLSLLKNVVVRLNDILELRNER